MAVDRVMETLSDSFAIGGRRREAAQTLLVLMLRCARFAALLFFSRLLSIRLPSLPARAELSMHSLLLAQQGLALPLIALVGGVFRTLVCMFYRDL